MSELVHKYVKGRLTVDDLIIEQITNTAANLYGYAVMLDVIGREKESNKIEEFRDEIFNIRSLIQDRNPKAVILPLIDVIAAKIDTYHFILKSHAPKEAACIESTYNELLMIRSDIKEHYNVFGE